MSRAEKLRESLGKLQEPKGYFFNPDGELVLELLDGANGETGKSGETGDPEEVAG